MLLLFNSLYITNYIIMLKKNKAFLCALCFTVNIFCIFFPIFRPLYGKSMAQTALSSAPSLVINPPRKDEINP